MNFFPWLALKKVIRPIAALLVLVAVLCLASDAWACPTCKDGLAENDPSSQAMVAGYFYSILFMMAMPFVIIGTFGSFAYLSVRKARQAETLSADASHAETL
ncbi:MAG: hypothetical protein IH831_09500 [Planctomycetes bacterium]|nr:hypothetical protein [Planctomycetota bacterium]